MLREYKKRPWVMRQNSFPVEVERRARVRIVIDKDFQGFDEHEGDILRYALAKFLGISPEAVKIVSKTKGSVQVVVELPIDAAEELLLRFHKGDPDLELHLLSFPVRDIQPETTPKHPDITLISTSVNSATTEGSESGATVFAVPEVRAIPEIVEAYEEKFRSLYGKYRPSVAEFYATAGFGHREVLYLTHETFLAAYKELGAFRPEETLGLWLLGIASRIEKNAIRAKRALENEGALPFADLRTDQQDQYRQRKPESGEGPDIFDAWEAEELSPLDVAMQNERKRLLRHAIEQLPRRLRQVMILRVRYELSYAEIASALRISVGTVKAHAFSARQMLREKLERYFADVEL